MTTDEELIRRLLLLAEQAVKEALDFEHEDPEDRYIWRELQELKQLARSERVDSDRLIGILFREETDYPITPPPELVQQWEEMYEGHMPEWVLRHVASEAAQWGADTELTACCKWLESEPDPGHVDLLRSCATALRAVRRPKPPSLKEQALIALDDADLDAAHENILRRALEALPDD